MNSGSEVVGAAAMPPVGAYVSDLSTISDRVTASSHGPWILLRPAQSVQNFSVELSCPQISVGSGGSSCDSACARANGTSSPAATVNSPTVLKFSPRRRTGVRRTTMSGPAMPRMVTSSIRVTQGTIAPYENRKISSLQKVTLPFSPLTILISCELCGGMKSIRVAAPSFVSKRVSRIRVLGR